MSTVHPPSPSYRGVAHFVAERAAPAVQMASMGVILTWSLVATTTVGSFLLTRGRSRNRFYRWFDQPHVERNSCVLMFVSIAALGASSLAKNVAEKTLERR